MSAIKDNKSEILLTYCWQFISNVYFFFLACWNSPQLRAVASHRRGLCLSDRCWDGGHVLRRPHQICWDPVVVRLWPLSLLHCTGQGRHRCEGALSR